MAVGEANGVQAYTLQGRNSHVSVLAKEDADQSDQVLCDFCRPNGIDMKEIGMPGRLNGRR